MNLINSFSQHGKRKNEKDQTLRANAVVEKDDIFHLNLNCLNSYAQNQTKVFLQVESFAINYGIRVIQDDTFVNFTSLKELDM